MLGNVELTAQEQELADSLHWTYPEEHHESAYWIEHGERAAALFNSLMERKAIPELRLRVFVEAKYNPGPGKRSHFDIFVGNAGSTHEVLRHYHFIKYLHYFIYGADLPEETKDAFACTYERDDGDLQPLIGVARTHARELHRRMGYHAAGKQEEFYRLALDAGCPEYRARSIRAAVMPLLRS